MKMFCCDFFGGGRFGIRVCGRVCTGWVVLHVIAEKTKIYSYLHVVKIPYPQDDS